MALQLCSFAIFFFTKPDKVIVKQLILLNASCNITQYPRFAFWEMQIFARESLPSIITRNNFLSLGPGLHSICQKETVLQIYQLVEITELHNAAGKTRHIAILAPCREWQTVGQSKRRRQNFAFVEFTVPINTLRNWHG